MSRHRHIRNLNIQDELEDGALSDGGEHDMTPQQQEQMESGLEQVRNVIGDESMSGLSDSTLRDVLWEYYFDIGRAIQWAIDEQQRRQAAQARKEDSPDDKSLPPVPRPDSSSSAYSQYPQPWLQQPVLFGADRPRVPLIYLAQQQQQLLEEQRILEQQRQEEEAQEEEEAEFVQPLVVRHQLSTITEERTFQLSARSGFRDSTFTSYGKVIDDADTESIQYIDERPTTPYRLSQHRPPPSDSSDTSSILAPVKQHKSNETIPSLDRMPEIPDLNSKTSLLPQPQAAPEAKPKKSKLSLLASSRASSVVSSVSPQSDSLKSTGTSVKTYPGLRPTAQSLAPPSTIGRSFPEDDESLPISSSASSHVRRAIQVALAQEARDKDSNQIHTLTNTPRSPHPQPSKAPTSSSQSQQASPFSPSQTQFPPPNPSTRSPPPALPALSPRRQPALPPLSPATKPDVPKSGKVEGPIAKKEPQQLSKLARLAQTKVDPGKAPKLPKPKTEYLTPIANGPTVTTAITTHYQSLFSLTDPNHSSVLPKLDLVPLAEVSFDSSLSPQKRSTKLAMKIRKGHEQRNIEPLPAEMEANPIIIPPMFDPKATHSPAKEREKAQRKTERPTVTSPPLSRVPSGVNSPLRSSKKSTTLSSGSSTPARKSSVDQRQLDLSALNIESKDDELAPVTEEPLPIVNYAKEKLIEEVKRMTEMEAEGRRKAISLVVIGHVDAGKSTLMGRLLYELGKLDEKTRISNERASNKIGKSSFSWAWSFDGTEEERERGITMDIGLQSLSTKNRDFTILDAPGHKDFIPNMISGASQADCALLVIDATIGEFEAGFERGGQTREHLLLVRSLGVTQLIVAINKLDQVQWDQARYDDICRTLRPFLIQSGFSASKTSFVPVGAMQGVNLVSKNSDDAKALRDWYRGLTLVDFLDKLEPPARDFMGPLRVPISNISKSQGSSMAVSGRICSGVVQVGEKLRILPGDETAVVKLIDTEQTNAPWAAAGSNVTLYLTTVDPVHLNIGNVLCSPNDLVPLATSFTARIIVFDIQVPIMTGIFVELFHHSRDLPATVTKLVAILDRATGAVVKASPRILAKGVSAEVEISLRTATVSGALSGVRAIPIEPFSANKDMGRILLRRGGETVAAGIVLNITG